MCKAEGREEGSFLVMLKRGSCDRLMWRCARVRCGLFGHILELSDLYVEKQISFATQKSVGINQPVGLRACFCSEVMSSTFAAAMVVLD